MDEGGPVKKARRPRPRYLRRNEEGVLVDEVVIRQREGEARRMADRERGRTGLPSAN